MGVLNGVSLALAGLVLWVAFMYRRPLGSPPWLYGSEPARFMDTARAFGALVFLLLLDAVPDLIRQITQKEPTGFFGSGYVYVIFFLGGWVAGRFGGRRGLYAVLTFIFLRALMPLVLIPAGLFFIDEAQKGQIFIDRVTEQWIPLLTLGPQSLLYTLGAAMIGAWQAYGGKAPANGSESVQRNAQRTAEEN